MVAVHLFSRIVSAWFAFALPCFRTFQILHHAPLSEDVRKWTKYWTVIGVVLTIEYTVEWLFSWFPFYWEIRMLFLLFLSLPQIQGSTFIYDFYLAPFLVKNEAKLDSNIASAQLNFLSFFQSHLSTVLDAIFRLLGRPQTAASEPAAEGRQQGNAPGNSAQAAAKVAADLWRTYGSPYLGNLYHPRAESTSPATTSAPTTLGSSSSVQSRPPAQAFQRGSFIPESQLPLPVTPEAVFNANQSPGIVSEGNTPPPFPVPQHF